MELDGTFMEEYGSNENQVDGGEHDEKPITRQYRSG